MPFWAFFLVKILFDAWLRKYGTWAILFVMRLILIFLQKRWFLTSASEWILQKKLAAVSSLISTLVFEVDIFFDPYWAENLLFRPLAWTVSAQVKPPDEAHSELTRLCAVSDLWPWERNNPRKASETKAWGLTVMSAFSVGSTLRWVHRIVGQAWSVCGLPKYHTNTLTLRYRRVSRFFFWDIRLNGTSLWCHCCISYVVQLWKNSEPFYLQQLRFRERLPVNTCMRAVSGLLHVDFFPQWHNGHWQSSAGTPLTL